MKKQLVGIASAHGGIAGCQHGGNETASVEHTTAQQRTETEAQKLAALTRQYFEESLARAPLMATFVGVGQYNDECNDPLSPQSLADVQAFEQKYLQAINQIDSAKLTGQEWLSYKFLNTTKNMPYRGLALGLNICPFLRWGACTPTLP